MEITKNELSKLSQIDRLEYRLDKEYIEETHSFIYNILSGAKYYIFFSLIGFSLFYSNYIDGIELGMSLVRVGLIIFFLSPILGIVDLFQRSRKMNKLNNKYFKIEKKEVKNNGRRKIN